MIKNKDHNKKHVDKEHLCPITMVNIIGNGTVKVKSVCSFMHSHFEL